MKYFKKSDIIIILLILCIASGIWIVYKTLFEDKPAKAEIYYLSELVMTVELDTKEDRIFTVPQNDHVVFHLYPDGSIAFVKSDCPDKVCIHTGKINMVGESAACLPNQLLVKIVKDDKDNSETPDLIVK